MDSRGTRQSKIQNLKSKMESWVVAIIMDLRYRKRAGTRTLDAHDEGDPTMLNKKGFTLIELLVVIAIITILASIVVPRVTTYIARGKMAKAVSEIRNCDLALTKMLADADRTNFGHIVKWNAPPINMSIPAAVDVYTKVFYELLRRGKEADLGGTGMYIDPKVKQKLATSYMDLPADPWGAAYQFYIGPLTRWSYIYPFRSYRDPYTDLNGVLHDPYIYDTDAYNYEQATVRGNLHPDGGPGFPCAPDLPMYIFSVGADTINNQWMNVHDPSNPQDVVTFNGGDDINNWDTQSGWGGFY